MNKLQKINEENNQLFLEVESKLDFLVKGQESNSNKLEGIGLVLRNEELLKSNHQLKQQLKEARARRKGLSKRDPMTAGIYMKLIQTAEGPAYTDVRLRIAICLLPITGIRINELLPLKVYQLQTLVEEGWIAIDRSKRGPASHSFRIGYITQLWKNCKDIEFVKQTIGHRNLDTTSAYVNQLE